MRKPAPIKVYTEYDIETAEYVSAITADVGDERLYVKFVSEDYDQCAEALIKLGKRIKELLA